MLVDGILGSSEKSKAGRSNVTTSTMSTTIWNTIYTVLDPELLYVNKDSGHMHERLLTLNILGLQFELYFWSPKPPNLLYKIPRN